MILTYGGDITIGDNCSVNPFTIVYGHGGTRIGNGVRIAAHTVIIPAHHNVVSDGQPLYLSGTTLRVLILTTMFGWVRDHGFLTASISVGMQSSAPAVLLRDLCEKIRRLQAFQRV